MRICVYVVVGVCLVGETWARPTNQEEEYNYNYNDNQDYQRDGQDDYDRMHEYGEGDVPVIYDKPDFVTQGQTINVHEGGSAQLSCQVNDLGGNQMIWAKRPGVKGPEDVLYLGDTEVTPDSRRSLAQIENNQGTILTISHATKEDQGTYICKIADPTYELQLEFTVSVGSNNLSVGASQVSGKDGKGAGVATSASVSLLTMGLALLLL